MWKGRKKLQKALDKWDEEVGHHRLITCFVLSPKSQPQHMIEGRQLMAGNSWGDGRSQQQGRLTKTWPIQDWGYIDQRLTSKLAMPSLQWKLTLQVEIISEWTIYQRQGPSQPKGREGIWHHKVQNLKHKESQELTALGVPLPASLLKSTRMWACASFTVVPMRTGAVGGGSQSQAYPLVLSPGSHILASFFSFSKQNLVSLSLGFILEFFTERVKNLEVPGCAEAGEPQLRTGLMMPQRANTKPCFTG